MTLRPLVLLVFSSLLISWIPAIAIAQEEAPDTYAGRDAEWWVGQLVDRESMPAAIVALNRIGQPALDPLAKALFSEDRRVRSAAVSMLRRMRLPLSPIIGTLAEALDETDLDFTGGVLALIERTGRSALPYLDLVAPYVSCRHREASARALGILVNLTPESKKELPRFLALAKKAAPPQRRRAVAAAMKIAPDDAQVVAALAEALGRSSDGDRRSLLASAEAMQPDAPGFAALVAEFTMDPAVDVRKEAAKRLGTIALDDRTWLPALITVLDDADSKVRCGAAWSIEKIGSGAAAAVEPLTKLLGNDDLMDDLPAVKTLAAIGPAARSAYPAVLGLLMRTAPSRDLKQAVVRFIDSDPVMTIQALGSPREDTRQIAFMALGSWQSLEWEAQLPDVLEPLEIALLRVQKSDWAEVQILRALAPFAEAETGVTSMFASLAGSACPALRKEAAGLLMRRKENIPFLVELLGSGKPAERELAFQAFIQPGPIFPLPGAHAALWPLLRSDNVEGRKLAARILIRFAPYGPDRGPPDEEDARALARAAADLLDDPETRVEAMHCLSVLGTAAGPYLPDLLALLGDAGPNYVNNNAAACLNRLISADRDLRDVVIPRVMLIFLGDDAIAAGAAAQVLASEGRHDAALLLRLPELMRDERKLVHFNAVSVAEAMKQRAAPLVPVLLEIAMSPPGRTHVGTWAINAIVAIEPENPRLMDLALEGLLDQDRRDQKPLFENALRKGGEVGAKTLANALATADAPGKLLLLSMLPEHGRAKDLVIEQVRDLIDDPDARVSRAARKYVGISSPRHPGRRD